MSMTDTPKPEWIAVDWGTSNLRVWAMAGGAAVAEADSAAGMGGLGRDGFAPALRAHELTRLPGAQKRAIQIGIDDFPP